MLFRFAFELEDWDQLSQVEQQQVLWDAIRALCHFNIAWLSPRWQRVPLLYEAGVRFIAEDQPYVLNLWQSIPRVAELGGGHCVGLTAWRVAELRVRYHEHARPAVKVFHENVPGVGILQEFHFFVLRESGATEDPSRVLGMP